MVAIKAMKLMSSGEAYVYERVNTKRNDTNLIAAGTLFRLAKYMCWL